LTSTTTTSTIKGPSTNQMRLIYSINQSDAYCYMIAIITYILQHYILYINTFYHIYISLVILYYSKLVKEFTYGKLFYAWEVLLAWSRMSKQIFSYHTCVTDGNGYRKKIVRIFPTESSQVMTLQVKKFFSEQYIRESTTLIHDSFIGLLVSFAACSNIAPVNRLRRRL
jgi:hypothetical protein